MLAIFRALYERFFQTRDNYLMSITLLDGGMGQEVTRRSGVAPTPLWSTRVMLDNPEIVQSAHLDFINAGADIITLNNYTATPDRLTRDATIDLLEPIHKAAIEIAHTAKRESGRNDLLISGCLPPLVASYKTDLALSEDKSYKRYMQLVELQHGGVDMFMAETLGTIAEGRGAARAGLESGKPIWLSFTLDDDATGKLRSGEPLKDAILAVTELGIETVLINCSMPETVERALDVLVEYSPRAGAYANGFQSIAALDAGGTVEGLKARKDLGPNEYADFAMNWVDRGLSIIGGCCEIGPAHIAELANRIER